MSVRIRPVTGPAIAPYIDALADLRIRVFRDFPYLYDGTRDYEERYIRTYAASPRSLFVLALDGEQVVGVSTGIPMADETEAFKSPFLAAGYDPADIFYFGESVLLPAYRGQGIGVGFFAAREQHAQATGPYRYTAFCAVERPADHPLRPADYVPLDAFWAHRGYCRYPRFATSYRWKDVDQADETDHPMTFWMREWPAAETARG